MPAVMKKEDAHRLIDGLPEKATWEDLMHEIYEYIRSKQIDVVAVIHGSREIRGQESSQD